MDQGATANNATPLNPFDASEKIGIVQYASGATAFDFANFIFDIKTSPDSTSLTLNGSFALYNENPGGVVDLNADMFQIRASSSRWTICKRFRCSRPTDSTTPTEPRRVLGLRPASRRRRTATRRRAFPSLNASPLALAVVAAAVYGVSHSRCVAGLIVED